MYDDAMPDQWLSLSEASSLLGVHASTLRRWADSGRVPCQRTPGGHRRFNRRKLLQLIEGTPLTGVGEMDPGLASDQPWHQLYSKADLIDTLRQTGQRLSGILVQYLLREDADERFLAEGRALGENYATESIRANIKLMDALPAFLFYRASFIDLLGQVPATEPGAGTRHFARYDRFMSQVLLAFIGGYESQ